MRNALVWLVFVLTLAAMVYAGRLQDRARRKAYPPGTSLFSLVAMFRSLATKEIAYFALLIGGLAVILSAIFALDEMGYLPR
jgi:uncharacterized membrane protein YhaH (DUF805 family)